MPRPTRRTAGRARRTHRHVGHSKAHCLKIFRRLSLYLDGELPDNACEEIRKHLHGCDNSEVFLASFKRTVTLCRKYPSKPLSPAAKEAIRAAVLKAVGEGSARRR
jgi:anti-sigma factor RsiW